MFRITSCILFCLIAYPLFSQSLSYEDIPIQEDIQSLETIAPFKISDKKAPIGFTNNLNGTYSTLVLDSEPNAYIVNTAPTHLRLSLPKNKKEKINLVLERQEILSPDFTLATSAPVEDVLDFSKFKFYWGYAEGYPESKVILSVFDGEMSGSINLGKEKFTLAKTLTGSEHLLYRESDLTEQPQLDCHMDELEHAVEMQLDTTKSASSPDNCVRLHIEVDYDIYARVNNVNAIANYITGAFNEVISLYASESINMTLSYVKVWNTPDPFTGPQTDVFLSQFTQWMYQTPLHGDIAHLVGLQGGGGIAYLRGLCSRFNFTGYSAINLFYDNVPNYSWTVNILAHEVGHSLGSPHTHSCSWNGNGTQIDDCGNVATGTPSSCYNPSRPIIPSRGTIMSYCHLLSTGVDLSAGFGQQPGDLMRFRVYNLSCLSPCQSCTVVGQTCDDGDECTVNDKYDDSCLCVGTALPDRDQDGYCQAEDPNDNDECVPIPCRTCTPVTFSLDFDNFPQETSFKVINASGRLIYSIGFSTGYTNYLQELCLSDGCYQFIIEDSADNGICCTQGNGSYTVSESSGKILVTGGSFGSISTHDFCLDSTNPSCSIGSPCDDQDPCTTGDRYNANCDCVGTFTDTDGDGTCDAQDLCPGGDDSQDADGDGTPDACDDCSLTGQTCDDQDPCTTGDRYNANCDCAGTLTDTDGDGTCDAQDLCPCLLYTSPSPRDATLSRMPSSA